MTVVMIRVIVRPFLSVGFSTDFKGKWFNNFATNQSFWHELYFFQQGFGSTCLICTGYTYDSDRIMVINCNAVSGMTDVVINDPVFVLLTYVAV